MLKYKLKYKKLHNNGKLKESKLTNNKSKILLIEQLLKLYKLKNSKE